MIFGAQYYPLLNKMTNWRQSLFALVLATRQYPNFKLWTEVEECQGATEFKHVLQQCWEYHFDKFNHIDLTEAFDQVAPYIPESGDDGELPSEGACFAFDAAICLNAAIEAIVMHTNDAESASKASMATVIRLCENRYQDEELTEDSLLEKDEILAEIDFQVELMELLQKPRTPEMLLEILKYSLAPESSNIGLESDLTLEDLYRPEEWEAQHKEDPANPWLAGKAAAEPKRLALDEMDADVDADADTAALDKEDALFDPLVKEGETKQPPLLDDQPVHPQSAQIEPGEHAEPPVPHHGLDGEIAPHGKHSPRAPHGPHGKLGSKGPGAHGKAAGHGPHGSHGPHGKPGAKGPGAHGKAAGHGPHGKGIGPHAGAEDAPGKPGHKIPRGPHGGHGPHGKPGAKGFGPKHGAEGKGRQRRFDTKPADPRPVERKPRVWNSSKSE